MGYNMIDFCHEVHIHYSLNFEIKRDWLVEQKKQSLL